MRQSTMSAEIPAGLMHILRRKRPGWRRGLRNLTRGGSKKPAMRQTTARSLVISFVFVTAACGPTLPSVNDVAPPAADAAVDPAARDASSLPSIDAARRESGAEGPARADGGTSDARAPEREVGDVGPDVRPVADARPDAGEVSPGTRAPRPGEIVIDELLVDPAGNDLGHEWIEIANVSGEPLDLATLHLSDGETDVALSAGVLPSRGLLVLGQSADRAHNGDAPVDVAYGTRLMLRNGAGHVAVCLGVCAAGVTVDELGWQVAWGDGYAGHAVVVERGGVTCPAGEPYGAGGNFGTPGAANPPCARPAVDPAPDGSTPAPDAGAPGDAEADAAAGR